MPELHLYPAAMTPDNPSESDGTPNRALGTVFYSDVDTYIVALEWYAPTTLPSGASLSLWTLTSDDILATTGTRLDLASFTVGSMTPGAWNRLDLPTPRFMPADTPRYVQVHITGGQYVFSNPNDFPINSDDGSLHSYGSEAAGNGRWRNSGDNSSIADTNPGSRGYNFFVGVVTNTTPLAELNATLDLTLPVITHELIETTEANATLAITLPPTNVIGEGDAEVAGALDLVLPTFEAEHAADVPVEAGLDLVLPSVQLDETAAAVVASGLSLVLPVLAADADGEAPATGSLGISLPVPVLDTDAGTEVAAELSIVLPVPGTDLDTEPFNNATLGIVLPPTATGLVLAPFTNAALSISLPVPVLDADAGTEVAAELSIVLPLIRPAVVGAAPTSVSVITPAQDIETVTVIRPPGRDRFGDPKAGVSTETDVPGCMFAPGPSTEPGFAANQVDTDGTIYGPPGMDVLATDRVRIRGEIYAVVGKPQLWGSWGVVVAVRQVTG